MKFVLDLKKVQTFVSKFGIIFITSFSKTVIIHVEIISYDCIFVCYPIILENYLSWLIKLKWFCLIRFKSTTSKANKHIHLNLKRKHLRVNLPYLPICLCREYVEDRLTYFCCFNYYLIDDHCLGKCNSSN